MSLLQVLTVPFVSAQICESRIVPATKTISHNALGITLNELYLKLFEAYVAFSFVIPNPLYQLYDFKKDKFN